MHSYCDVYLTGLYRSNDRRGRLVRKCVLYVMSLGYLPTALVRQTFRDYGQSNRVRQLLRQTPRLGQFMQYVDRVYVARGAAFPVFKWNVFDRTIDTRTNNHVERFVIE
jgi:hypothetical protein